MVRLIVMPGGHEAAARHRFARSHLPHGSESASPSRREEMTKEYVRDD
jgi:hypothetical protein